MMSMDWKNRKQTVLLAAAVCLLAGTPALGAEFVTPDAVLALETPDDGWKQVADDQTWVTLSDGTDKITLLHYGNGEELPEMAVAGAGYERVCQAVISTENEVFIITGSVVDQERFEQIRDAVDSVEIRKYDTKTRVNPAEASESGASSATAVSGGQTSGQASETADGGEKIVEKADFTVWVSGQQLNVRSASSTDAAILGCVFYADALEVTGVEKQNGAETGWYQVNYNGSVGYVSAAYVSTAPDTAETLGYTLTDERVTLYQDNGEAAAYVYRATNGNWYDGSGRQYQPGGSGQWTCLTSGSTWSETAPQSAAEETAAGTAQEAVSGEAEEAQEND